MFGKYLKHALCALIISATYITQAIAVPAMPGWRTYTQPSGETFTGALRGDEYFNFTVKATEEAIRQDPNGSGNYPVGEYTIDQDAQGVWYYVQEYVNPNDSIALQVLGTFPAHLPIPVGLSPRILPAQTKTTLPGTAHLRGGMELAGGVSGHRAFLRPANPIDTTVISLALYTAGTSPCPTVATAVAVAGNAVTMEITEQQLPPNMACIQVLLPRLDVAEVGVLAAGDYDYTIKRTLVDSNGGFISSQVAASGTFTVASSTPAPPPVQGKFDVPATVTANADGSFSYQAVYTPATPTSLSSYTISSVTNTQPPGLIADGWCLGPATTDSQTVSVSGNLVDLTQNGVVSINYSSCNGDHFYVETTILPPSPSDPCISNPTGTGCPQGDDDNDGVKNSRDRCPGTATGLRVNRAGCATHVRKPPRHR